MTTSLEKAKKQSEALAKQEAEMGQREAGRPSSGTREVEATVNRLQEKIRAIVRKSVAMWWDPLGQLAPLGSLSGWVLAWKLSSTILHAYNRRQLQ